MQVAGITAAEAAPAVYLVLSGAGAELAGLALAERVRDALPGQGVLANMEGGSFKTQLKRADKSGASVALIVGDDEAARGVAAVKWLRDGLKLIENAADVGPLSQRAQDEVYLVPAFVGLGAQPPTAEWGSMIGSVRNQVFSAPHLIIFPGAALSLSVLAFNLLGDGIRDALDPRLNR